MLNVQGLRRNVKNVVKNYTDAQVKVREATSNDPWGPSSTLMTEIADLTYNVVAFSEIMQMIWKRLNDHGKNWRHVYKALMLLEYLIKTGSEKVAQQCKENIFAIQTLKDFQYIEENKDQGMNVREKSKQLVSLLKDDERLKNERTRALKAKERFAQAIAHGGKEGAGGSRALGKGSSDSLSSPEGGATSPRDRFQLMPSVTELENARPQTVGEEELQLQLALAMSKEEAEQEERLRRNDDLRLQMALNESQDICKRRDSDKDGDGASSAMDLLALNLSPGSGAGTPGANASTDPWGMPIQDKSPTDPWLAGNTENSDPWASPPARPAGGIPHSASAPNDPWCTNGANGGVNSWLPRMSTSASVSFETLGRTNGDGEDHEVLNRRSTMSSPDTSAQRSTPNPFDMTNLKESLQPLYAMNQKKTPETFLGPNSNLVNLDALVNTQESAKEPGFGNPFGLPPPVPPPVSNPFQGTRPPPPTINQLRTQNQFTPYVPSPPPPGFAPPIMPTSNIAMGPMQPLAFSSSPQATNPFL